MRVSCVWSDPSTVPLSTVMLLLVSDAGKLGPREESSRWRREGETKAWDGPQGDSGGGRRVGQDQERSRGHRTKVSSNFIRTSESLRNNRVLAALPQTTTGPLQQVQIAATWLIFGLRTSNHTILSLIQQSHWLPIAWRIRYKLCWCILYTAAARSPEYLADMIKLPSTRSTLRLLCDLPWVLFTSYHVVVESSFHSLVLWRAFDVCLMYGWLSSIISYTAKPHAIYLLIYCSCPVCSRPSVQSSRVVHTGRTQKLAALIRSSRVNRLSSLSCRRRSRSCRS